MFIFVGLIDKDCINAHAVEVLNIISGTVEHFSGLNLCVLSLYGSFLSIFLFLSRCWLSACKLGQFFLTPFYLAFCSSNNRTITCRVCLLHLFKYEHLFLNHVLDKLRLTLYAIRNTF